MKQILVRACPVCMVVALSACEPDSIADARDQLARGGERDVTFTIPVRNDTITVADVLEAFLAVDFTTILDSLVAVPIQPVSVAVAVADSVGPISGVLDPATNPFLTFETETWAEVPPASLDLGRFEDAVRNLTVNTALVVVAVQNTADAPITLEDFTVGVAQIDPATGDIRRDAGGDPLYEVDAAGQPILVELPSSGSGQFQIPRNGTAEDTLAAGALVDRLADRILDGVRVALVEEGTVVVGDGTDATITGSDELTITVEPFLGFDFTFGTADVQFDSTTVQGGLDLDATSSFTDADAVADVVDSAGVTLTISNGTPFALEASIAVVEGSYAGDVFAAPDRVELETVTADEASVDAQGRAQAPGVATRSLSLSGDEARVFFGPTFTAGLLVQLRGPSGGRGAMRPGDRIVVDVAARATLRTGGSR